MVMLQGRESFAGAAGLSETGHREEGSALASALEQFGAPPVSDRRAQRTRPMKSVIPAIVLLAMLAACGEPDSTAPGSEEPVPAPEVDADPTPQTGRGGPSQTTSPDATTNSAPAAD
jgi:hypothetical protein